MSSPVTDSIAFKIIAILREDFQVDREIGVDSLVCFDLGVCDDEFRDLIMRIENRFSMELEKPCIAPFSEANASVGDLAEWVQSCIK